ncbi:MAG: GxxExxY protein [Verrucomicrobia bacterium]|nr:GxxExxY protein [Verrucomicrobiota bacterium]
MSENELSNLIIGAAIEVHKELGGPGLLEDIYEEALCQELVSRGLRVERQVPVPVMYKGRRLKRPLVLDILVEDKVIIEVKAVEKTIPVFGAQLLTYLRLSGKKLGLLINFGETRVSEGIQRVVNHL